MNNFPVSENEFICIERNGIIFRATKRPSFLRFDPIFTPTVIGMAMAGGTGMQMYGQYKQGKQSEDIANYNANVSEQNAKFAKENATEQARIQSEQGRRFTASQTAAFAASGVKTGIGAPLLIEAQTQADIAKDVGFIMQGGQNAYDMGMSSADMERKVGKNARKNSYWDMATTGVNGFGSLTYMSYKSGWGNKPTFKGANNAALNWMNS